MVPKLRQHDLKLLHSWFSEDTQPRANGGFYSTLCFLSTSNICFDLLSFQVLRDNRLVFIWSGLPRCHGVRTGFLAA